MRYSEVYEYWSRNPCKGGFKEFPFKLFKGLKILEIGCGMGADAERFVENDCLYTGIDLTDRAVNETKRIVGRQGKVLKMNAEFLDFPDNHFDLVYSFGVIHHAITPRNVINEAYRVCKEGGIFTAMFYNKPSIRYNLDIMFFRILLWYCGFYKYRDIKKKIPRPTNDQWIAINTDTIGCPVARVYTKQQALTLCNKFDLLKTFTTNFGWFRIVTGCK